MHMIYIDDSGQPSSARRGLGELVAVGGVIVPEPAIAGFDKALTAIRIELGIPDGEEIKWNAPKGSFLAQAGVEFRGRLRRRMLQAAIDMGIKSAVVIWDRGHLDWPKEKIAPKILDYLYERFDWFLREKDDVGVIIADEPGGGSRAERAWLAETLGLTSGGTRYATPERIVSPIVTAPSDHVPHLQLADLVTAATTAAVAGRGQALELVPWLKQLARTNAYNLVGGAGVVLWPRDQLMDLFYWVFGENVYVKAGEQTLLGPAAADPLFRQPGRPFLDDDGLPAPAGLPAS
ncbi:hypothetical protein PS9374_04649 [Planomonospora sphaerica]|uniref:DUF3800 domain-containing protein n=1 Tax=Planomonospora sphaerica TaxID=161355 RepID=A0A161LJB1_9ACTN|nr:DUF3800 domain-containing protein [Planomonospora sphaerica]GAT68984.1 hypothetical protein PS9374_04649 [Planomonospora sphaerica]